MLRLHGGLLDFVAALDFGVMGYLIVGMFLLAWGLSVAVWKMGRIEQRYSLLGDAHTHTHDGGVEHTHANLHQRTKPRP